MIDKKLLKTYAAKLMFDMSDEEYETLEQEFAVILRQMENINKIEEIKGVDPMTFPFDFKDATLREDEIGEYLSVEEVLANTKHRVNDQVKVPKVVE